MYAQCVRASRDASIALCQQSIRDIRNVRDAWRVAAESESAATEQARDRHMYQHLMQSRQSASGMTPPPEAVMAAVSNRWSA
jgi:hypothetical protein